MPRTHRHFPGRYPLSNRYFANRSRWLLSKKVKKSQENNRKIKKSQKSHRKVKKSQKVTEKSKSHKKSWKSQKVTKKSRKSQKVTRKFTRSKNLVHIFLSDLPLGLIGGYLLLQQKLSVFLRKISMRVV